MLELKLYRRRSIDVMELTDPLCLMFQMMDSKSSLKYSPRMQSSIGRFLDLLSCLLTCPLIVTSSMTVSTLMSLTPDTRSGLRKLCDMALVGPALGFLSLVLLPFAIFGFVVWILINIFCDSKRYSSVEILSKENSEQKGEGKYSFATMNILLGQDAIGKFNNCSLVYNRIPKIAAEIRNQEDYYIENLSNEKLTKSESVVSKFPRMDFICFQEVFDRIHSLALISMLRKHYRHFIFDIGDNSLGTNGFLLNSGLMIASKYPIMEVKFHPFSWKNSVWQKGISYGVVTCKLDLGSDNVGLLSNLHTMAYEGPHHLIDAALTEVKDVVKKFRKENVRVTEKIKFDVICGDFNMDNMSPCDIVAGNNDLFSEYRDIAGVKIPGQDQVLNHCFVFDVNIDLLSGLGHRHRDETADPQYSGDGRQGKLQEDPD